MANCIFTLAWAAKETCHVIHWRVGRRQRVHVIGDTAEHWCRPPELDVEDELDVNFRGWYLHAGEYDMVASDLFNRVRLALLDRRPVIFWNP